MEEIIEALTCIQDEIELLKDELIVAEPKKSLCETWKDNFLTFWKKNIKLE